MGTNINQSIDKIVKDRFLTIFNEAQKRAEVTFKSSIISAIENLSNYDKIKYLKAEKDKLKLLEEKIKVRSFVGNSTNKEWLLKSFASRLVILNTDESDELDKSVYLGYLFKLISTELVAAKDSIPSYSYDDFVAGKEDSIFLDLGYYWHFDEITDTEKIRLWQVKNITSMLSIETSMVIKYIQSQLRKSSDALEILTNDLEHYDHNIKNRRFESPDNLIEELRKLTFLTGYDFSLIKDEQALADYHKFLDHDLAWNRITPKYINRLKELMTGNTEMKLFSTSPIIFYTIIQIIKWIEKVVNGQPLMQPFNYPDYDVVVDDLVIEAKNNALRTFKEYKETMNIANISNNEAQGYYVDALEGIRLEVNDLKEFEKQYFAAINRKELKEVFQLNSIFFNFDEHKTALKKVVDLNYRLNVFYRAYISLSKTPIIDFATNEEFDPHEVDFLMSTMVIDNNLYERLSEVYKGTLAIVLKYSLPIDFAAQYFDEHMHEIFIECVESLLSYLEDCEPGNKVLYIQSRLKELRQRELKNNILAKQHDKKNQIGYTTLLKEYLEIEAEFISSTKDVRFIAALNAPKPKKELIATAILSFGYKQEDTTKLLSFISELNLKIDLLNEQHTTPNDLMIVLSASELTKQSPKIYFNCETTQLSYIFNKLKTYFSKLTLKNIEKSQLFFTKNGNPLKAQNLSASKVDNPKEQVEIDKAFSLLQ